MTESEKCKECIEFAWEGGWMGWKKPTIRYDIVFDQKDDFIYLYTNPRYDERVAAECFFFSHDFIRCALKGAGLDPELLLCYDCGEPVFANPLNNNLFSFPPTCDCNRQHENNETLLEQILMRLAAWYKTNTERLNFLHETLTKK